MTDRELMQQALETLDYEAERGNDDGYRQLRDALRERLAEQPAQQWNAGVPSLYPEPEQGVSIKATYEQPAQQQEPVSVARVDDLERGGRVRALAMGLSLDAPLYTSPPKRTWVGLTDEEKSDLWCESTGRDCVNEDTHVFADAIEAKLRMKNA